MLPYATSKAGSQRTNLRKKAREIARFQARIEDGEDAVPISCERPFCSGSIRSRIILYISESFCSYRYIYMCKVTIFDFD